MQVKLLKIDIDFHYGLNLCFCMECDCLIMMNKLHMMNKMDWFVITYLIILIGGSSCHHHPYELFVVDVSVSVDISFSDHLVDLLVSQLLSQVSHYVS